MSAVPMDSEVDQRLSMSLDDLIKSKKTAAPTSAAKNAGSKAGPAARSGASGKQTAGRGRRAAKDKKPTTAKPSASGGAKAAGRKRGGRAAGTGLGVNVAALKNAPSLSEVQKSLTDSAIYMQKRIAEAAANAINAATAMVTGSSRGGGRGSSKPKAGGRGRGRGRTGVAPPARGRGRGGGTAAQGGAKPVADLRVTIDNKLHGRGRGGRGRSAGGRGGGRQSKDGVKIPTGW